MCQGNHGQIIPTTMILTMKRTSWMQLFLMTHVRGKPVKIIPTMMTSVALKLTMGMMMMCWTLLFMNRISRGQTFKTRLLMKNHPYYDTPDEEDSLAESDVSEEDVAWEDSPYY